MPVCKHCHSRIEKFNKDMCPICGGKNPLEGVSSETIEITGTINVGDSNFNFKQAKKSIMLLLFILLGFTGAGFFYMKKNKPGLIHLGINISFIGIVGLLISLIPGMMPWGFIIAFGISILLNTALGIYLYSKNDLKDGQGEFLR